MQIKSVLEMHDFSGINRKVQLKKGNSSKALAETESEAEDTSKYFFQQGGIFLRKFETVPQCT